MQSNVAIKQRICAKNDEYVPQIMLKCVSLVRLCANISSNAIAPLHRRNPGRRGVSRAPVYELKDIVIDIERISSYRGA
jgi:hypothetical protein